MPTATVIADHPPRDGREWDCQCARCGSSCDWTHCTDIFCDAHDDGLWDEDEVRGPCDICGGRGGWWRCLSSPEWCEANPLIGDVPRGKIEWFTFEEK